VKFFVVAEAMNYFNCQ